MILFVICLLLLLYGLSLYERNHKRDGLLIFFFFLTNGFQLINDNWYDGAPITKCCDFALLYLLYALFRNIGNKRFYRCHFINYKWQLGLFTFITIDFVLTVVLQQELVSYSIKTYRLYLPLLSFFLIQELSIKDLRNIIVKIAKIVLLTVVLHVSQLFLGVQTLQHTVIDEGAIKTVGIARYRNIPYLCYFLLMYFTVVFDFAKKRIVLLLFLCIVSLLLSQHRGPMIAYVLVIGFYVLRERKSKLLIKIGVLALLITLFFGDVLIKRFVSEGTGQDIQEVVLMGNQQKSIDDYDRSEMGNFTFRVLLLRERIDFLCHNPKYIVSGVGLRHEDSPLTSKDFNFNLGTGKPTKDGFWRPAQIISVDLAWQTPLMLFGFGGVFLFCMFTILNILYLGKHKKESPLIMAAYLYYIFLVLISFKNDHLFGMMQICYLTMFIELIRKQRNKSRIKKATSLF